MTGSLNLLKEIQRNNMKEHKVEQELKKGNCLTWEQNRITYMDRQIYILNNRKLKEQILWENYNLIDISYLEQRKIIELVKMNY